MNYGLEERVKRLEVRMNVYEAHHARIDEKKVCLSTNIPESQYRQIEAMALDKNVPLAQIARMIFNAYFEEAQQ